jgi:serine/threonine-protein kinase
VVLWEALTGRRLFDGDDPGAVLVKLLETTIPTPREVEPTVSEQLDQLTMKALSRDPAQRFASAREFAIALEQTGVIALPREVGEWVDAIGGETVGKRAAQVAEIESVSSSGLRTVDDRGVGSATAPETRSPFLSSPESLAQQAAAWQSAPVTPGEPSTNPSQVSHVTGISYSGVSAPSVATGPSQVTDPSQVGRAPGDSARRGVFAVLAGVAAALGLVLVVLVVVLVLRGRNKPVEEADVIPVAKPTTAETKEPAPQAAAQTAPPIVSVTPSPSAEKEPEAEPAPSAKPQATRTSPVKSKTTSKATSRPAGGTNCDPPYVIDKKGVRRVKPGCM